VTPGKNPASGNSVRVQIAAKCAYVDEGGDLGKVFAFVKNASLIPLALVSALSRFWLAEVTPEVTIASHFISHPTN